MKNEETDDERWTIEHQAWLIYCASLGLLDHKEKVIADSIDWLTDMDDGMD